MTFVKILSAAAFGLVTLTSVSAMAAGNGKLIAIITPSHDNPFFATEADGAAAKANGPRLRHAGPLA